VSTQPAAEVAVDRGSELPPVIALDDLRVSLGGRPVLKGLTCELRGRCIGLLGPNGAGKSTLLNTLLGFHPLAGGSARVFGRDLRSEPSEIRSAIGYMPESDAFIADMTGVAFVRYMAELAGLPARLALERTHEAFLYVGLGEARYRKVGTYSLGMKQMAKLAQAIVHGPRLLLLDEPTNGLDPPGRQRMLKLIREIRDTPGVHLLVSSHLLRDVEECCDEVLILKNGILAARCNLAEERQAQRKFLELETTGGSGFPEAAARLGCEYASFGNGRLKLVLPDRLTIRQLYVAAAEQGAQIRGFSYRRDSLEDIFLKAMETPQDGVRDRGESGSDGGA
jgi:ABC-2 type transport system ATP-binding protein